jgi:hypothetical protein
MAGTRAHAEQTCKYVDGEGRITFANVPVKNARKVMCFDPVPQPAPKRVAPPSGASSTGAPTPGAARVDAPTQRRRDDDRRRILEQELAEEQRLLESARQLLVRSGATGGPSSPSVSQVLENLGPAYDAAKRHERNIEAIQKELGSMR